MPLSKAQQKKKTERAHARKEQRRIEEGAVDIDTGEKYAITVLDDDSSRDKRVAPVVEENLKTLRAKPAKEVHEKLVAKRVRYAQMKTHMETAAIVIAAGGSAKLAARKAGVSRRQIRKYMESADFRDRIAELQETLGGRIRGRVISEVKRRTDPEVIKKMELLDLLRVGDRFGLGRGNASTIINDNRQVNSYEANFNALFHDEEASEDTEQLSNTEEEGADFPEFEPTSVALSGGDSPVEG